ncbi:hypothetical protein [Glaciecola sp. 1036]|uniref:hypothetical protein n=1 Tax=Alteromonadaceae TaxID=72275 RepID=UPI003D072ADA
MSNAGLIRLLKIVMTIGFCLILLGVYFHMFSETVEEMGVKGIILSACCVAIGMILSLPTKMFLTFVLVKREQDLKEKEQKGKISR